MPNFDDPNQEAPLCSTSSQVDFARKIQNTMITRLMMKTPHFRALSTLINVPLRSKLPYLACFYITNSEKIEEDFIPGLLNDVSEELNRERAYRLVVDSIIRETAYLSLPSPGVWAVAGISKTYAKHDARDSEELQKLNRTNKEKAIEKPENHEVNQPIHESNDKNTTSNNDEIHNQEG
ncbi:hypothetical protein ACTXT7_014526 [Hymenolepis weldensis]